MELVMHNHGRKIEADQLIPLRQRISVLESERKALSKQNSETSPLNPYSIFSLPLIQEPLYHAFYNRVYALTIDSKIDRLRDQLKKAEEYELNKAEEDESNQGYILK
jgi:hypothetical protein